MGRAAPEHHDTYRHKAHEAALAARRAADAAAHAASEAREWAEPRAKEAYRAGARKAKPYVHKAGTKAEQWADVVHGAIVGAAIPAVLSAVDRAANEPEPRRAPVWPKVVIPMVLAAAAGAALVVWARRDPGRDDWAGDDEWELFGDEGDFPSRLRHDINKTVDLTVDASKKAASAVSDVVETVGEKAGPLVDQVRDTAVAQGRKVASAVDTARSKAVEALDDAEDVWEDEGGPVEEITPPTTTRSRAKKAAQ